MLSEAILNRPHRCPLPAELTREEAALYTLAAESLPVSDLCSMAPETLLSFVKHALFLQAHSPFCRELPERFFLHYVFCPRVNSENLVDCRRFFYDRLAPRTAGLSTREAILEVNRWCAEQMTYQASDSRTESPMTAFRSGIGRCGEESVFAVTALRSIGIPARQIYVPFWAHCDDNHAWVEAYCDGDWHYFGACEPEPVLDRGWFTDAASRAPLACYRSFLRTSLPENDVPVNREGCCTLYNVISRYAPTELLTISVKKRAGKPVSGARVRLDVVNSAAFCPVAVLETDENGCCRIELGRTTVHVETVAAGERAEKMATPGQDRLVTLVPGAEPPLESFACTAPAAAPPHPVRLTPEQQRQRELTLARCALTRGNRIRGYFLPEYQTLPLRWQEVLRTAAGNASELYALYRDPGESEREAYLALLETLAPKDWRDTPASLLRIHRAASLVFRERPQFVPAIENPRIGSELLEDWRTPIGAAFSPEQKALWREDPPALYRFLEENYPDGDLPYYPALTVTPAAALRLGHTDEKGRKTLFVAILRTLGVPARLNPGDGGAEYGQADGWHPIRSAEKTARLELEMQEGKRFTCRENFTLSRLEGDSFRPLWQIPEALAPGTYRLLTANRLPNGSQLCRLREFTLAAGETGHQMLMLDTAEPEQMLGRGMLEPFTLTTAPGTAVPSRELLTGKALLVYLDVGKEPSEHTLMELTAAAPELRRRVRAGLRLCFVLRKPENRTDPAFQKACAALPEAEIYYDNFSPDSELLARKLFLEPGVRPLLVLTDGTHRGFYGTCGYQVGAVALALNLADVIPEQVPKNRNLMG